MKRSLCYLLMLAGLVAAPIACHTTTAQSGSMDKGEKMNMTGANTSMVDKAVAVLVPTAGHNVRGVVTFEQLDNNKVKVIADLTGFEPNSTHGIHIHQYGDLRKDDGTSAGGHFNPEDHKHARPHNHPRHAGDLGNLRSDDNGKAHLEITVDTISVCGMNSPILGRGMIVHAKKDDGGQPTGNAGARIAMGVIGVANPKMD